MAEKKQKKPLLRRREKKTPKKAEITIELDVNERLKRRPVGLDIPFLLLVLALVAFGLIMVWTASHAYAKENYNNSYFFATRQIMWIAIGTAAMIFTIHFDYLIIRRLQLLFFIGCMALMLVVPYAGYEAGGATRWFQIGPVNFQPSEFAKLAIILFFADHISRGRLAHRGAIVRSLPYIAVFLYMAVTLFLEPHISCIFIVLGLIFVLMVFGGISWKVMGTLAVVATGLVGALIYVSEHARLRIQAWLHPELYTTEGSWQPLQSLYAIGSGGFWGVGFGESTQKHLYLPEPQNDYIFAILCEELGFVGAFAVIVLFVALVWRGIYIAKHAPSNYACLVVIGIVSQVAIQMLLNIAVVTNSIPATGIPLPFFSYGGTSLIILMAEMGMVLNISRYTFEKG